MNRHDILSMEERLWTLLHKILRFQAHAIYFPHTNPPTQPVWLPEESRLLLPLRQNDETLGVFMARGLERHRVEALLPDLPAIADICLDNLELYKAGRLDAHTGLATRAVLTEQLNIEAANIRAPFENATHGRPAERFLTSSMALLLVRFAGMDALVRQTGHGFAQELMACMASELREGIPVQALVARTGDHEFAAILPNGDNATCRRLAVETAKRLAQTTLPDPLTRRRLGVTPYIGFAIYPNDMDGTRSQDMASPAPVLLHKAGLAADVARTLPRETDPVIAYSGILANGGVIRRVLPLARVDISLGRGVGAREGLRFSVWSTIYPVQGHPEDENATTELQPLYKGEIVILEAGETSSVAEIITLGDPAWPLQPGDTLTCMPGESHAPQPSATTDEAAVAMDAQTGLYRHGEFLTRMVRARETCSQFTLTLLHVSTPPGESLAQSHMTNIARLCHELFQSADLPTPLGGRFALNSLIFFHADSDTAALQKLYATICTEMEHAGMKVAVGLAAWPFMHYRASDMLECVRKSLEYALLLPAPCVGLFGSLALNISADKRHCRGDMFGAIEEYKAALLADPDNALAWNSLGVCMAGLGRHEEALRHFKEALQRSANDAAIAYNMGVAYQSLNDFESARAQYQHCLTLAPAHLYATLRLAQLADLQNNTATARELFQAAAASDEQCGLPHRYLARIAHRENDHALAREHLHRAILRNPRDAESMSLMARLYLEGGEDAELAESLARQSVALRPDRKSGWIVLAQALEARGLTREAKDALLKAEDL